MTCRFLVASINQTLVGTLQEVAGLWSFKYAAHKTAKLAINYLTVHVLSRTGKHPVTNSHLIFFVSTLDNLLPFFG